MFHFFTTTIELAGLAIVLGAVLAYRDRPSNIPRVALPGAGLLVLGIVLAHGLPGSVVAVLASSYLFGSVAAACVMTVAKAAGRISATPGGTLAFSFVDGVVLGGWAAFGSSGWLSALSSCAFTLWGLAFVAWVFGLIARAFTAPVLARRKSEADAAIARMQAEERAASEGEGW